MSRLYFNRRIQMYLVFFILVSSVNVSANNLISSKESCNELMHFLIEEFSSAKNKSDEKYFTNHVLNDSIRVKYFLNQIKNLDPVVNFETHDSRNKYEVVLACLNSVDLIDKIIFNTEDPKLQLMAIDSIEHFKNTDSKELKQKLFDLYAKMNSNLSLENEVRKRAYENNRELSWGEKSLAGFVENSSRFNQLKSWKIYNEN